MLNVWLYAALLPLWDGFDEPFHYGFVHELSHSGSLPVSGRTMMPVDLCESLRLVPAGVVAQRNLKFALTHEEYLRLPAAERQARRAALRSLPAAPEPGGCFVNYEAQQAPLAYAVLALPDLLLARAPLPDRILILRGICGTIALLMLMAGFAMLSAELKLSDAVRDAALLATLCVQMFYATTTHITNDFLAAPLFTLIVAASLRFFRTAAMRDGVVCAVTLVAALATKAYYLAVLPVFVVMLAVLWRSRRVAWTRVVLVVSVALLPSSWWYLRNLTLYGSLSGINQANGGATLPQALRSLLEIQWPASLAYMLRGMIWTGNNSFTAFSQATLNILLFVVGIGVALFLWRRRGNYLMAGYFGMFVAALIYSAGVFYFEAPGQSRGSSPWYILPLVPALYLMATRGLGAWSAPFLVLNVYVINATYVVKLIPQYGGYAGARSTPGALWNWYTQDLGIAANLRDLCLGPPVLIAVLTGLVLAGSVALCVTVVRNLSGAPAANQE
ncbi:MAG: hypothetical protein IPP47_01430 [Bryobacterales bacterium]|nr:hypothetical protein [Bryobacterales bacterium]